ncbi:endonuclease/exonuclease/phosphatase family protein [Rhizobiaceae bacterium CRRU44]|uniref:Endonuclease/exonuclease/phosphatase family protein n=1 Tax=Ferranicluibacter rubi TaxID=2715133 RepID=A0AA44CBJ8_9HYPH|nr:endonuclease/exonuclease/phosphatase family protein [Ferranicluibacter rubi]NHT75122.1 endonuclease/exonuclease/phosphatase family protein [Ferranicluibacter rubi]
MSQKPAKPTRFLKAGKTAGGLLAALRARRVPLLGREASANARDDGARGDTVVASYNIHKCVGTDKRFDPGRIMDVICEIDADIIALQEADQRFGERAGLLDLERLHRDCHLLSVPIAAFSPKGHGWHGNLLLVREGAVAKVSQLKLPGVEPRGALVVDLDLKHGPLRIIAAHFGLLRHSRGQQARAILAAIEEAEERPTLLIGDLNEWRIGKRSALSLLSPIFDHSISAVPSFPSRYPLLALDRVMGSPHTLVTHVEVHNSTLSRVASDHLPLKAHIDLQAALSTRKDLAEGAAPQTETISTDTTLQAR